MQRTHSLPHIFTENRHLLVSTYPVSCSPLPPHLSYSFALSQPFIDRINMHNFPYKCCTFARYSRFFFSYPGYISTIFLAFFVHFCSSVAFTLLGFLFCCLCCTRRPCLLHLAYGNLCVCVC